MKWLRELSGMDVNSDEVSALLTSAGLEVEDTIRWGDSLESVVIAEVCSKERIPSTDKLSRVRVFDGQDEVEVICGAPNVPGPGERVLFAQVGATLPNGLIIAERKIAGIVSRGMICSDEELNLGSDPRGIHVVDSENGARAGTPVADALDLRDSVLELGVTPNRPDCLGHLGVARELCALREKPFLIPEIPELDLSDHPIEVSTGEFAVCIEDVDSCPRYGAAVVSGVKVDFSPFWLRYLLHRLGIRAISNAVDATNLVLLETGHPIHGFDLQTLSGPRIIVRRACDAERMMTLDQVERELTEDDLLVCDAEGPVALAGVMGGAHSELSEASKEVLIECAYFEPRAIRRTSRRFGLHTEASHRFERGVDPNDVPLVLARAGYWIGRLCGGTMLQRGIDCVPRAIVPTPIRLRSSRLSDLLGMRFSLASAEAILSRLGCRLMNRSSGEITVAPPSFRPDLKREIDLIEEVARVTGYDEIPSRVPKIRPSPHGSDPVGLFERRLLEACVSTGLHEAINYSFVSPSDLKASLVPTDAVELANPLSEERSVMRTSLLPGLLSSALGAQRHQCEEVTLFELGRQFHPAKNALLPEEQKMLALLILGSRSDWIGQGPAYDFYDLKGMLSSIVDRLTGRPLETVIDSEILESAHFLHPRRCAVIRFEGFPVGLLGEVHPDVVEHKGMSGRPIYAEIEVIRLYEAQKNAGILGAPRLPRFPSASRDLSLLVDEGIPAGEVRQVVLDARSELLESVTLFDLYRSADLAKGKKSLSFRLVYRDPNKTLIDKRVDKVHQRLTKLLRAKFDAEQR
ncbi:MAG: phenylalanine--tRNA ligase subunit beta [Myxococcota bacterium]